LLYFYTAGITWEDVTLFRQHYLLML